MTVAALPFGKRVSDFCQSGTPSPPWASNAYTELFAVVTYTTSCTTAVRDSDPGYDEWLPEDSAIDGIAEKAAERLQLDIRDIQNRFVQIRAGPEVIVVVDQDVGRGSFFGADTEDRCCQPGKAHDTPKTQRLREQGRSHAVQSSPRSAKDIVVLPPTMK